MHVFIMLDPALRRKLESFQITNRSKRDMPTEFKSRSGRMFVIELWMAYTVLQTVQMHGVGRSAVYGILCPIKNLDVIREE